MWRRRGGVLRLQLLLGLAVHLVAARHGVRRPPRTAAPTVERFGQSLNQLGTLLEAAKMPDADGFNHVYRYDTTHAPTKAPTTHAPTKAPTTHAPTKAPTTHAPTKAPTKAPTTHAPTSNPTKAPTIPNPPPPPPPTHQPTTSPTTPSPTESAFAFDPRWITVTPTVRGADPLLRHIQEDEARAQGLNLRHYKAPLAPTRSERLEHALEEMGESLHEKTKAQEQAGEGIPASCGEPDGPVCTGMLCLCLTAGESVGWTAGRGGGGGGARFAMPTLHGSGADQLRALMEALTGAGAAFFPKPPEDDYEAPDTLKEFLLPDKLGTGFYMKPSYLKPTGLWGTDPPEPPLMVLSAVDYAATGGLEPQSMSSERIALMRIVHRVEKLHRHAHSAGWTFGTEVCVVRNPVDMFVAAAEEKGEYRSKMLQSADEFVNWLQTFYVPYLQYCAQANDANKYVFRYEGIGEKYGVGKRALRYALGEAGSGLPLYTAVRQYPLKLSPNFEGLDTLPATTWQYALAPIPDNVTAVLAKFGYVFSGMVEKANTRKNTSAGIANGYGAGGGDAAERILQERIARSARLSQHPQSQAVGRWYETRHVAVPTSLRDVLAPEEKELRFERLYDLLEHVWYDCLWIAAALVLVVVIPLAVSVACIYGGRLSYYIFTQILKGYDEWMQAAKMEKAKMEKAKMEKAKMEKWMARPDQGRHVQTMGEDSQVGETKTLNPFGKGSGKSKTASETTSFFGNLGKRA